MNKFERESKIIMEIEDLSNWKTNLKKIAEKHNIAVSTVHAVFNRLKNQNRIKLWVEVISEKEAHDMFILKKAQEIQKGESNIKYCECGNRILDENKDVCMECK